MPTENPSSSLYLQAGVEPLPGYRLVRRLGGGGFGEVWEADAPGGFHVAMKFVRLDDRAGEPELRALEIIKDIRHPNLLVTLGAWKVEGWLIVVMELADGTLLDRFREAQKQGLPGVPRAELLLSLHEAAKGLDYLNEPRHALGGKERVSVQHRDVKPQNILLVGGGVKVADFGLARVLERSVTSHTGSMTPAYAAPEFFKGQTSSQSDQYSLAVTYCQLRGGQLPFAGSHAQIVAGHLMEPPDLTMLPEEERPAVARALSKEPEQRWPNCRAFVEALQATRPSTEPPGPGVGPRADTRSIANDRTRSRPPDPAWNRERPRRRWPALAGMGILIATGTGAALWAAGAFQPGRAKKDGQGDVARVAETSKPVNEPLLPRQPDAKSVPVEVKPASPENKPRPALTLIRPLKMALKPGETGRFQVKVSREAVEGPVHLTPLDLPDGVRVAPATVAAGQEGVEVSVEAGPAAPPGEHRFRLAAACGEARTEGYLWLTIEGRPRLELFVPGSLVLSAGAKQSFELRLSRERCEGPVKVRFLDVPSSVTLETVTLSATETTKVITALVTPEAKDFEREITLLATLGEVESRARMKLVVKTPPALLHHRLGLSHLGNQQLDQAIAEFTKAIQFEPENAAYRDRRGFAYYRKGDYDKAVADYSEVIRLTPNSSAAFNMRGQAHHKKGDLDKALDDFNQAIRLRPTVAGVWVNRGEVHLDKAKTDKSLLGQAHRDFSQAIRIDAKHAEAHAKRAQVHYLKKELDSALNDLNQAVQLAPKSWSHYHNRGVVHAAKGDSRKAIEDLSEAIRLHADDPTHYDLRAKCYDKVGEAAKAKADQEKAAELRKKK